MHSGKQAVWLIGGIMLSVALVPATVAYEVPAAAPESDGRAGLRTPERFFDLDLTEVYKGILTDANWLVNDSAKFWIAHGPDTDHGGFKGSVARDGAAIDPEAKGLVSQARFLWSFATMREAGDVGSEVDPIMDSLYNFIVTNYLNTSNHLFWQRVNRDGSRIYTDLGAGAKANVKGEEANMRDAGSKQWLYGQAFAIHGIAAYARVANSSQAMDVAMKTFEAVDNTFHDSLYGGFNQIRDDGLYIDFPGNTKPSGELGKVEKVVNAHLQYLPAYTELYKTTKDLDVADRLYDMMKVFAVKLPHDGYVSQFYTREWEPLVNKTGDEVIVPRVVVGHELETAEYLFQAAEALKNTTYYNDAYKLAVIGALNNTKTAFAYGWDDKMGGWYNVVDIEGNVIDEDHIWWVQNESLPTLYRMYSLTGDNRYLLMIRHTLNWIRSKQTDPTYGEQYWGVWPNGTIDARGDLKGEFWKANYHVTHGLTSLKKLVPAVS